jgi:hypothetical protein
MSASSYAGGCHCGAVRFSFSLPTDDERVALVCNCSVCRKRGFVHIIVEPARFELESGHDELISYRFNTKVANHLFCGVCGVQSFYRPRSHPEGYSVNLRCLDAGAEDFRLQDFDGANWEASIDQIR